MDELGVRSGKRLLVGFEEELRSVGPMMGKKIPVRLQESRSNQAYRDRSDSLIDVLTMKNGEIAASWSCHYATLIAADQS